MDRTYFVITNQGRTFLAGRYLSTSKFLKDPKVVHGPFNARLFRTEVDAANALRSTVGFKAQGFVIKPVTLSMSL